MNGTLAQETAGRMHGVEGRYFAVIGERGGLIRNQVFKAAREYRRNGEHYRMVVAVRFDDQCGNKHETFSITADIRHLERGTWREHSGGCCHDEVAREFPELARLIPWHLTSTDGPMHYVANAVYHAGDRDHRGLRKGEQRQLRNGKTGQLAWIMKGALDRYHDGPEAPADSVTLSWAPWMIEGEGKARDFAAARSCAVWPEATDEELSQEPEALKAALIARAPALHARFKAAMLGAGFMWPDREDV
jgi:hypothetical protein